MKYSVNGNHLNTHIVNMCCCNAINRVLITPFFCAAICSSIRCAAIWYTIRSSIAAATVVVVVVVALKCNEQNEQDVYVIYNIGRNSRKIVNRQLLPIQKHWISLSHKKTTLFGSVGCGWKAESSRYLCEFVNFSYARCFALLSSLFDTSNTKSDI